MAHLACPFVLKHLNAEDFREYALYLIDLFKQDKSQDMLRKNFSKFHRYPSVELFEIEKDILRKD